MPFRPVSIALLLQAVCFVPAAAQIYAGNSIPHPTELSVAAENSAARIIDNGTSRLIESDEATAEAIVIRVEMRDGENKHGVRIRLRQEDYQRDLYLDADQVAQLRDELAGFVDWYNRGDTCGARSSCMHGIARCRPSQTVPQAFCLGFYTKPDGRQGVSFGTSDQSFRFPYVEPSVFVGAIDAALDELEQKETSVN